MDSPASVKHLHFIKSFVNGFYYKTSMGLIMSPLRNRSETGSQIIAAGYKQRAK